MRLPIQLCAVLLVMGLPGMAWAGKCTEAVQGRLAWDGRSNTTWSTQNLRTLCQGAEESLEPAQCFETVMSGQINWGGGTSWNPTNALDLCRGATSSSSVIACFNKEIAAGRRWQDAIPKCRGAVMATIRPPAGGIRPGQVIQQQGQTRPSVADRIQRDTPSVGQGGAAGRLPSQTRPPLVGRAAFDRLRAEREAQMAAVARRAEEAAARQREESASAARSQRFARALAKSNDPNRVNLRQFDCDDSNANIYPGAQEICDGIDNDCDFEVDEGLMSRAYLDNDGDSFGDPNEWFNACRGPDGLAPGVTFQSGDCNDGDPTVNPAQGNC